MVNHSALSERRNLTAEYTTGPSASHLSEALLLRAQGGCHTSLKQLLRLHERLIHALIRREGSGSLSYREALHAGRISPWRAIPDPIWEAGALRLVDIRAAQGDHDPAAHLTRGYNDKGYPLCPLGYAMHSNGHDYRRRLTKWRCAQACLTDAERTVPDCAYLKDHYKHGTTTVGRTHADGTIRLAHEIPYGSRAWKARYNHRNSAQERLGLKRLPVHGLPRGYSEVLLGDLVANQRTLARLVREAASLLPSQTT